MRTNEGRTLARVIRATGGEPAQATADRGGEEAARRAAAEILSRAQAEADEIRRRAYEEGLAAAQADSAARDAASDEAATRDLLRLAVELAALRDAWLRRWETNALRLAAALASRIVRREARERDDLARELACESLELAAGCARVRVALHPDDARRWETQLRQFAARSSTVAVLEVVPDESLERGECRVTTDQGEIDQRFDVQLARLVEELTVP